MHRAARRAISKRANAFSFRAVKQALFQRTMVLALTNGGRAYIGTDDALAMGANGGYKAACLPNWGGHETMSPHFGPPAVGCEKTIHGAFKAIWQSREE